ncbi:SagB/ThcOx family dehydrogenase [Leeia sp.]|uniref:SagB/ThcOx family dehydrogenase n=1 Tax=Leeia sp. TaxID=2884678 RepID=UPI0035B4BEF3
MTDTPDSAPLFRLFWDNSSLTPSRALVLRERIAIDAAQAYRPYRPIHVQGSLLLPKAASRLESVWSRRRSQRHFKDKPLSAQQLSSLLRPFRVGPDGRHALPSGGGKYPLQLYVALLNVTLAASHTGQLAWYDPEQHGLVPLGAAPDWAQLACIIGVDWAQPPAVMFFLIARSDSLTAKYGERGGRFMLLEAGAHMLALDMEAASQKLGGVPIGAFMDDSVLQLLNLSARQHQAVLCYACGHPL